MTRKTVAQHGRRYRQQLPKVDDTLEGIELPPPLVEIVHNLRPTLTGAPLKREVSKLHTALRDSHIQTAHARGWFQPERYDTSGELKQLVRAGCLEYREILEPGGRYGYGRYAKQYRITPAGSRLLGLDHPIEEGKMDTPAEPNTNTKNIRPGDKASYNGQIVTIRGHVTENGTVSVELTGDAGHLTNRYVSVDDLTRIPTTYADLTQGMLDFVRETHPDRRPHDMVAWVLMGTLRIIHSLTAPPDGWHEITARRGRLQDARLLAQGGLVEIRNDTNVCADVRITPKGSAALGWLHPLLTQEEVLAALFQADPDDEPAPAIDAEPQPEAAPAPTIEVRTLIQSLHYTKERSEADAELAGALMAGWHLVHIQIITHADALRRVVTLQRFSESETAPQPVLTATFTAKSEPAPVIDDEPQPQPVSAPSPRLLEPVGDPITILPGTRPVFELGPWGRAIRENGLDETLDIADQRVTDTFRQTYEESLARNQIIVRPLLPTQTS